MNAQHEALPDVRAAILVSDGSPCIHAVVVFSLYCDEAQSRICQVLDIQCCACQLPQPVQPSWSGKVSKGFHDLFPASKALHPTHISVDNVESNRQVEGLVRSHVSHTRAECPTSPDAFQYSGFAQPHTAVIGVGGDRFNIGILVGWLVLKVRMAYQD
jgi:hypothetical protein